jgi:Protein of unknown function, DUF481
MINRKKQGLSAFLLLSASAIGMASSRVSTDVVYMRNGDKITCEIKSLNQGQLTVKPDYSNSSIALDWTKVDHVESSQGFVVTDPQGKLYTGTLGQGKEGRSLTVKTDRTETLSFDSVVEIEQLGQTFLKRFRGNIDLGTSFAQSNNQRNLTFQSGLTYQSAVHIFSFNSNSQFSSQERTNDTNETTVKTSLFRQLHHSNWYGGSIANFLSSSEQQIALRSTLGGAIAKRVIFTNRTNLNVIGGLAFTIERDAENATSTARTKAMDSAIGVTYSMFRFDSTTFDTNLWVYPSITSPGRVRMTLNQDIYYKFLKDFYLRLSFYDNYDNQPVVGAPSNNLGASTSVGWSFH